MINEPVKVIHKYKNNNKRIQYLTYIFIGNLVPDDIFNTLESISNKDFYETLNNLSRNKYKEIEDYYGEYWYKFFFNKYHIKKQIDDILKNSNKRSNIESKYGKEWFNIHFKTFTIKKTEYSFASNYYDYLIARNKIKSKVKKEDMDFTTYNKDRQFGGNGPESAEYVEEEVEYITDDNIDEAIDEDMEQSEIKTSEDLDDEVIENFDLEELTKLYSMENVETDKSIKETAKLISEATNDRSWLKESKEVEVEYDNSNDNLQYDSKLEETFEKIYINENYIYMDDNVKTLRAKVAVSIPLNPKYGNIKLLPEYQYFWTEYNMNNTIESVMLGQKWIRRNELLKIDIQPNENLSVYENLKGNLSYLRESFGIKLKREDDESLILRDYKDYMTFNEIYMIDIVNEMGLNFNSSSDKLKNLYEVYVNIYYPFLPFKRFEEIIELLNKVNNIELDRNENIFRAINNDIKLENEISTIIEETKLEKDKYKKYFNNNNVLQSIIHVNLNNPRNQTGTVSQEKYNLYKIFDSFIVNEEYPFVQYQTPDAQITYKFYEKSKTINDKEILNKWFETAPYGISFKIRIDEDKYMSINFNENGRLEYKVTFREEDGASFDDIKKSYLYVNNLLLKINSENKKIKIVLPTEDEYKYAFINTILKFTLPEKFKINHNDLSDFCRFFFTYIALVIEPKKRKSKSGVESQFSKFGTYLRYKRVSNYDNKTRMHLRMLYFLRNFEVTDKELIDEIAKQFNITREDAAFELDQVKVKYGTILAKVSKKLNKLKNLPKSKPPGIGVDIQGRTSDNYKIRITGSRSKEQLMEIEEFIQALIYLYSETYFYKKPKYQKIKNMLVKLTKIAKRRNLVNNIVDYDEENIKEIKIVTKLDKKRLGFRPEEGQNQWTRSCQNSGEQKRQPIVVADTDITRLLKKGYKLNPKTNQYEKEVVITEKGQKKKVIIKAVKLSADDGKHIYYTCNPDDNNDYIYVGFLSKSNNPNELCMPCCFKKDQSTSSNLKKKAYYNKCIGNKDADNRVEKEELKASIDKIYVLQETNKIQEGRFIFLNKYLNQFFNSIWNHDYKIKNHYLIESNSGYFLKFTVKDKNYNFLAAMANIYDTTIDNIKDIIVDTIKNDKNNNIFTWLNNGDIKSMFKTKEEFINFIKDSNYLGFDIVGELLSIPNVLSNKGITYFVFEKKVKIIKKDLEKDEYVENYYIDCLNVENKPNKDNDIVILLREGIYYFPIFWVKKSKSDKKMIIVKKLNNNDYSDIINELFNYYNTSCYNNFIENINQLSNINAKNLSEIIKYKILEQIVDERNKVIYLYCDIDGSKQLVPTKPSGSILNLKITKLNEITNKYYNNINVTIKNLKKINKIEMDFIPITIYYDTRKKGTNPKYNIVSLLLKNKLIVPIKNEEMTVAQFKKYGLGYEFQSLGEVIDKLINSKETNKEERNTRVNQRMFRNEGYNLFRLEFSYFINKNYDIRDKIVNIVRSNVNKKLKKKELIDIINNIIYKKLKKNNNILTFVDIVNKLPDLKEYNLSNIREYCHIYKTKDKCNKNPHCSFSNNECRFRLYDDYLMEYTQRLIEEMIQDKLKFKELIQEDDYFVSDIVDYTQYSNRPDQKIIKTSNFNINKILSELFGKNNIPKLGRRKNKKSDTEIEENYPELNKIGDLFYQEVINNDNSIIRAYVNSYYWLNNNLYDTESRNLGYYSDLQDKLVSLFKANIIDYILNNTFNKEFKDNISKYFDLTEHKNFFLSAINRFRKNKNNTDGIVELIVLSYLLPYPIIVYDNFNNVKYIFSNGIVKVNDKTIKKYTEMKNIINIKFDYEGNNNIPYKIFAVYK
jgi:hypothetical protein